MRASVECRIRHDRPNKNGEAGVYLQVIINSQRTTIPLQVRWPVRYFDRDAGRFLQRFRDDQEATDQNIQVNKEKGKVNDIFMYYRHSDSELTLEQFQKEYRRYGARADFIQWAMAECEDRYKHLKIEKQTWKNHMMILRIIRGYKERVPFYQLTESFLESLDTYLRKRVGYKINTAMGVIRTLKAYARRAEKVGIAVDLKSLDSFNVGQGTSRIVYLRPDELERMKAYLRSQLITADHKQVLRQFLFSTVAGGLRFSDIQRVSWKEVDDNMLRFIPWKTRKSEKVVNVPLIPEAFTYIENSTGNLFDTMTEQATNRALKEIAAKCNIRKVLSTHVARHTFATEFLRRGGHIEVLQKLLGHSKISTTMIYTHVDDDRLWDQMKLMQGAAPGRARD